MPQHMIEIKQQLKKYAKLLLEYSSTSFSKNFTKNCGFEYLELQEELEVFRKDMKPLQRSLCLKWILRNLHLDTVLGF